MLHKARPNPNPLITSSSMTFESFFLTPHAIIICPSSSKFLLMLRDGRASVHSMISRRVTIAGFNLSSYRDCLTKWSNAIEVMLSQCMAVGQSRCMTVRYEDLVLQPRATMHRVLRFLNTPWHEGVLHHEEAIGQPGGVSLSRYTFRRKGSI